ncbi:MAG: hydrogenase nickel incorporation protein HypA [Candidatus Methanomethylicia archaeon]
MHEWALAEAVIVTTNKIVEERRLKKIKEVVVKIGELQQVDIEIFEFALSELKSERGMNDVEFRIELAEAKMMCKNCGYEWNFKKENLKDEIKEAIHFIPETAHVFLRCPRCGSPDFEIISGRGVWIESIVGEL